MQHAGGLGRRVLDFLRRLDQALMRRPSGESRGTAYDETVEQDKISTGAHPPTFTVYVEDNYNFPAGIERYKDSSHATYGQALAAAKHLIDAFLEGAYRPGKSPERLYGEFTAHGEDPIIEPTPAGVERFSGWDYAKRRCSEICCPG